MDEIPQVPLDLSLQGVRRLCRAVPEKVSTATSWATRWWRGRGLQPACSASSTALTLPSRSFAATERASKAPAAEGAPAEAGPADATPALTRDALIAAAGAVRPDDGCVHSGEEG